MQSNQSKNLMQEFRNIRGNTTSVKSPFTPNPSIPKSISGQSWSMAHTSCFMMVDSSTQAATTAPIRQPVPCRRSLRGSSSTLSRRISLHTFREPTVRVAWYSSWQSQQMGTSGQSYFSICLVIHSMMQSSWTYSREPEHSQMLTRGLCSRKQQRQRGSSISSSW